MIFVEDTSVTGYTLGIFLVRFSRLRETATREISSRSRNHEWVHGTFFIQPRSHRNSSSLWSGSLLGRTLGARTLTGSGAIIQNILRSTQFRPGYRSGN